MTLALELSFLRFLLRADSVRGERVPAVVEYVEVYISVLRVG